MEEEYTLLSRNLCIEIYESQNTCKKVYNNIDEKFLTKISPLIEQMKNSNYYEDKVINITQKTDSVTIIMKKMGNPLIKDINMVNEVILFLLMSIYLQQSGCSNYCKEDLIMAKDLFIISLYPNTSDNEYLKHYIFGLVFWQ